MKIYKSLSYLYSYVVNVFNLYRKKIKRINKHKYTYIRKLPALLTLGRNVLKQQKESGIAYAYTLRS